MRANVAGQLLVPILAIVYSTYMVLEQVIGGYRDSTVLYGSVLGGLTAALGIAVVAQVLLARGRQTEQEAAPPAPEAKAARRRRIGQMVSVFGLACLLVYLLTVVGYLLGVFVFLVASLRILGVTSLWQIVPISVGTTAVIHLVFVKWLDLGLPAGVLTGLI